MSVKKMAILCSACGQDTFVRREPIFEGFRKTGEHCVCIACGHVYMDEDDVPFKTTQPPNLFSEEDRSQVVDIFAGDARGHNCRHCRHYVLNPFVQRCGLHMKEVEAIDVCEDFQVPDENTDKDPLAERLRDFNAPRE